jgi:ADP-ribose pyrophosphatase YjhB (NUDIX family)
MDRFAHCGACGARFAASAGWPRTCASCGLESYRNPLPVAVLLLPVDGGLLLIRRAIEPHIGKLALPGGYVNFGESWQEGAVRELKEETGFTADAAAVREFRVLSAPDGTLLVFGIAADATSASLPAFVPSNETSESVIIKAPMETAFPLHTRVVADYFRRGP